MARIRPKSSFEFTVDASSVDTGDENRDNHLRSPDFFDAKQFPEMTFTSTAVEAGENEGDLNVMGELDFHGVTEEIEVVFRHVGHGEAGGRFGYRAGYETQFTLKRSEYANDFMIGPLGDEVTVLVSMELIKN